MDTRMDLSKPPPPPPPNTVRDEAALRKHMTELINAELFVRGQAQLTMEDAQRTMDRAQRTMDQAQRTMDKAQRQIAVHTMNVSYWREQIRNRATIIF